MPFANRTIALSADLNNKFANVASASMPDYSRAVEIGAQEAEVITRSAIYNRIKGTGMNPNKCTGYVPYVLQLKHPCYVAVQYNPNVTESDDDNDWCIAMSPYRTLASLQNAAATNSGRPAQSDIQLFYKWWYIDTTIGYIDDEHENAATLTVIDGKITYTRDDRARVKMLSSDDDVLGYMQRRFEMGRDLWHWFNGVDQYLMANIVPLGTVGWYYRPALGGHGSDTEDTAFHKIFLIPTVGTSSGTLLATRRLFYGRTKESTFMNQDFVWGTVSGSGSSAACSLTVNSKDNGTGTNLTAIQPFNIYCP